MCACECAYVSVPGCLQGSEWGQEAAFLCLSEGVSGSIGVLCDQALPMGLCEDEGGQRVLAGGRSWACVTRCVNVGPIFLAFSQTPQKCGGEGG